MLGNIYMVVLYYMRKTRCKITDSLKTEERIKRERERIERTYKEETKRFLERK